MNIPRLFVFFIPICCAQNTYIWKPSLNLSDPSIYEDNVVPCENDDLIVDGNRSIFVFLNGYFQVRTFLLPRNGEVTFGERTVLNQPGQCRNKEPSRRSIREIPPQNFYSPQSWRVVQNTNSRPMLDAMRVPGDQDDVIFPLNGSSIVILDTPAIIKSLRFGDKPISSEEIYHYLLTLEGQSRFQLEGELAATVNIGNVTYKWPDGRVFSVLNMPRSFHGQRLSNTRQPQFGAICSHVKCEETSDYCDNPIKPVGHCCPVCAAVATFRCDNLPLFEILRMGFRELENMYPLNMGLSKIRLDQEADHPAYQVAVIPDHPENYDEDVFNDALDMAVRLSNNWYLTVNEIKIFDVRVEYSTQRSKIHVGRIFKNIFILFSTLGLIAGLFLFEYRRNPHLRLWMASRVTQGDRFQVVFRRGADLVQFWQRPEQVINAEQQRTFNAEFENLVFNCYDPPEDTPQNEIEETSSAIEDYLSISDPEEKSPSPE